MSVEDEEPAVPRPSLAEILGPGGKLAEGRPGFVPRPSQLQMAELVETALSHQGVAIVEAGTGTGKTFAYLLPALLSGKRVVVSTGTRALQDQIAERDVPALEAVLGERLPVAVLKGLPNYLCRRRLAEVRFSPASLQKPELVRALGAIERWAESSAVGDRAELRDLPEDDPAWNAVGSSSETRIGPRCRYFDSCFATQARRRAESARLVVVNHHLYFADLALRSAGDGAIGVLPPHDAVIFDEAHQIEDVLTLFFGVRVGSSRIETFAKDAERALVHAGHGDDAARRARFVMMRASDLYDPLPRTLGEGRQNLSSQQRDDAFRNRILDLDAALDALVSLATSVEDDAAELVYPIVRRGRALRDDLAIVLDGGPGLVVWAEEKQRSVSLGASPIDVSTMFREQVLHRTRSVVLTSATLSTAGSFAFLRARLGIEGEVDELLLPSPFDWEKQALLYLPPTPDPRHPTFAAAALEEIVSLALSSGGGAFVLATSRRSMDELSRAARPRLQAAGLPVLVQGERPKSELLDRFRASGKSVLFATQSFWEGVDVPGHALRLVVIDRLPFDVPTDPLVAARTQRLEEEGRAAFMEYHVPAAALSLKQAFGRLVRTESDRGVVAILDGRITQKGYGKIFLRTLPPARVTSERAVAIDMLATLRPPS